MNCENYNCIFLKKSLFCSWWLFTVSLVHPYQQTFMAYLYPPWLCVTHLRQLQDRSYHCCSTLSLSLTLCSRTMAHNIIIWNDTSFLYSLTLVVFLLFVTHLLLSPHSSNQHLLILPVCSFLPVSCSNLMLIAIVHEFIDVNIVESRNRPYFEANFFLT